MSKVHVCDECGLEAAEDDLYLCALSTTLFPRHECIECVRECGPCRDESAREFSAEVAADIARFGP